MLQAGDVLAAAEALEEASAISRAVGNQKGEARSLQNAGSAYRRRGDLEKAIANYERALPLARAVNDHATTLGVLNNMGVVYKMLGAHDRAMTAFEQALADARATNDERSLQGILANLGNLHRELGDHRKALQLHGEMLVLARRTGLRRLEATALGAVGLTYYALGEFEKALAHQQDSLAIRRELADVAGQATALTNAGLNLHAMGQREEAIELLGQALAIRHDLSDERGEAGVLSDLAAVERDHGRLGDALASIERAVALDEALRRRLTSPELRATFGGESRTKYELFIDLLQQRHLLDPTGGHERKALDVSERGRARVLLDSLLEARVELSEGVEPLLLERERAVQKELSDASARLSEALTGKDEHERTSARDQLSRLDADYQEVQQLIRQRSPRYAALTQPEPLTAAQIQQEVLDQDTVLLEFTLGEKRSWLWAVTSQEVTSVELPSRREVESSARTSTRR